MLLFTTFLLLAETGCKLKGFGDSGGPIAYQTQILNAYAVPSTVAPGDTAKFVCVIADSTNKNFRFYWCIHQGTHIGAIDTVKDLYVGCPAYVTSRNQIKWKAPDKPDEYDFEVQVFDTSLDLAAVDATFSVIVKQ